MDINAYLAKPYGPQPCWELVADVMASERGEIPVDYKTVNRSIREMSSAFRIAIHKSGHGFAQILAPVDLCIVLLGKTEKIGIHHCGIYWQGSVLHAMPGITLYEPMSVIEDRFELIEFWAKPAAPP
jgi:hypothetical protein